GVVVILVCAMLGDFFADGHAGDPKLVAASVVALHEHADGVADALGIEDARGGSDSAFEFIADHASAAAYVAFFDEAAVRGVERVESVVGLDVKSIDIVEPAVPGFS